MEPLSFTIVDVFAENKYEGNQLAVFRGGANLSDVDMQRIAKEMNYSETTFIVSDSPRNGGYDVRIFTPEEEVPFAGHPTLGSAFVIQNEIVRDPITTVTLHLKAGPIPVTLLYKEAHRQPEMLWMKQNPPVFGETYDPEIIARVLSVNPGDIDARFPVQEVSTGLPAIIVPIASLNAIKRCKTNREPYYELINRTKAKVILMFCPQTYDPQSDLNVRVFVDVLGVPEDPATGSANGNLAAYLVKHRYFNRPDIDIRVEQGYEIKRPSMLYLQAREETRHIDVHVGGKVIPVARGHLV